MAQYKRPVDRNGFEIAILCALAVESDPILALFDEHWEDTHSYGKAPGDPNTYATGRIGRHNVVVVFMPGMGKAHAASVAASFRSSFRNIKLGLLSGICGGVPGGMEGRDEIILGDVIISTGIIQYDFGRQFSHQVIRKNTLHDMFGRPSPEIRSFLNKLMGIMGRTQLQDRIITYVKQLSLQQNDHWSYPGIDGDYLFEPNYSHKHHDMASCMICSQDTGSNETICDAALELSCVDLQCDANHLVSRKRLEQASRVGSTGSSLAAAPFEWPHPKVHFGLIASGDLVMKTAQRRDAIAKAEKVIAFEMESAGVWDQFPTVVIKGVGDYADSHKNKTWQNYAAVTAAACVKAFLTEWRTEDVTLQPTHDIDFLSKDAMSEATLSRRSTIGLPASSSTLTGRQTLCIDAASQEDRRRFLLESLRFDQIDARQLDIKNALDKTCAWLLDAPEYSRWLDPSLLPDHHGILWIKGKPAAGKSTIMKFALQNAEKSMSGSTVISFFFNARGEDLEQSTLGMYRSLLFQIFQKIPDSVVLLDRVRYAEAEVGLDTLDWSMAKLQNLFESVIEQLEQQCLICFIDALDECGEEQIREMVKFFERTGQAAIDAASGCRLLICFSSRHYPHITIENSVQLVLEDQENHQQDISKYINTELKIGRSKLVEPIKTEILERASGIFLWVVLVVRILIKEYDGGRLHALKKKLKEIPDGLEKLFKSVLTKDGENMKELILCIRWIRYARYPLKCEELYHGILIGLDPDVTNEWDPDEVSLEDMERFVLSSSKGLAEVSKGRNRRVQFIHESVRDFLLGEMGLERLQPSLSDNFQGTSHDVLKQCCQHYLSIATNDNQSGNLESLSKTFPLLEYAAMNILWHADAAHGSGVVQTQFMEQFGKGPWIGRRNYFGKYKRGRAYTSKASLLYIYTCEGLLHFMHDEIQKVQYIDVPGEYYGYPVYAALFNKDVQALQALLQPAAKSSDQNSISDGSALYLSEHARQAAILRLIQESGGQRYTKDRTLLSHAAEEGNIDIVKAILMTEKANFNAYDIRKYEHRTPLGWAIKCSQSTVVKLLIGLPTINLRNVYLGQREARSALEEAIFTGSIDMVRLILSASGTNLVPSYYTAGLRMASTLGHLGIVQLLLADVRVQPQLDDLPATDQPLWSAAIFCSHRDALEIVRMILGDDRVNPELRDDQGRSLFHAVVQQIYSFDTKLGCKQLVEHESVEYESHLTPSNQTDQTIDQRSQEAVYLRTTTSPEVLPSDIDQGTLTEDEVMEKETDEPADEDAAMHEINNTERLTSVYTPPLVVSDVAQGDLSWEIADVLLHTGKVDPNSKNRLGHTALHSAVIAGNGAAIKYLLSIDQIDPNLLNHRGYTPLHLAIQAGPDSLVKELLDCDKVMLNMKDIYGLTPMLTAICEGNDAIVKSLVETDLIDIDSKDETDCPSAIWVAAMTGCEQIVKILSTLPLGKSIPKDQQSIMFYRRVMQHVEGREAYREWEKLLDQRVRSLPVLQDYQMQLMLLDEQNKKRILMARQGQYGNAAGNTDDKLHSTSRRNATEIKWMIMRKAKLKQGQSGEEGSDAGNFPLQDYQMQLMLLDQQNKKRLALARSEAGASVVPASLSYERQSEPPSSLIERQTPTVKSGDEAKIPESGTTKLRDYQVQLMLLEQQNRKRQMLTTNEESSNKRRATASPSHSHI